MSNPDIARALRCCHSHMYNDEDCTDCPYDRDIEKCSSLEYDAADLIEAQQARIEELEQKAAKHSHWIIQPLPDMPGLHHELYTCAECHMGYIGQRARKFCPECGSSMDEPAVLVKSTEEPGDASAGEYADQPTV